MFRLFHQPSSPPQRSQSKQSHHYSPPPNQHFGVKANLIERCSSSSTLEVSRSYTPPPRVKTWGKSLTHQNRNLPFIDDISERSALTKDCQQSNQSANSSNQLITPISPLIPQSFHIITINVSGLRFQTFQETLSRYPHSLLGNPVKLKNYYNPLLQEYFFDRHRKSFESILYIHQSPGIVGRPESVPIDIFLQELEFFFGDNEEVINDFWKSEGYLAPPEQCMPKRHIQKALWKLMEFPDSSICARFVAFLSVFVIIVSVVSFCLETLPAFRYNETAVASNHQTNYRNIFFIIETVCIFWFTIELSLRFLSCPNKCKFCTGFLNIIDLVAILPFFVNQIVARESGSGGLSFAVLRVVRLVRVFRIFKLSRHSVGLQILGKTFTASVQEFCLLIFFMCITLVLFSSSVYFAEGGNGKFNSIPASFWYAVVTMTTVGYGDMVPETTYGKLVGVVGSLIGVLTLALPVPIIVANFTYFYKQETKLAKIRASSAPSKADDMESIT